MNDLRTSLPADLTARAAPVSKAYILSEIKRTAAANGGAPLGRQRFESETGIKESDWYGRHRARWGDAIQEAGCNPNQFQPAFDKAELLGRYARLSQELHRLPTRGDLKLKRRRDGDFPSANTFYTRFGSKSQLVSELAAHCGGLPGFEDIERLCKEFALIPPEPADESTHVDFGPCISSSRAGFTKSVGRIRPADVDTRWDSSLQSGSGWFTRFERTTQLGSKLTGINVLRQNGRTGNGLNSTQKMSEPSDGANSCKVARDAGRSLVNAAPELPTATTENTARVFGVHLFRDSVVAATHHPASVRCRRGLHPEARAGLSAAAPGNAWP